MLLGLLRAFYRRADAVFVHGEASRREFLDTWSARDVHVIPHGDERLLAPDTPPPPADDESILFFGEWRRAKGLHVLIDAFDAIAARRPEARLTIAGVPTPDVDPAAVRRWAEGHGGRVTLVDRYLEIPEVRDVFARARVVAAPYVAGSQSGVVHLAMTMARPVVASDVGELPHAVADGVTGRVVPSGDSAALADALEQVLGDAALAEEWGNAARRRVLEEFGWERVAERVEARAHASAHACRHSSRELSLRQTALLDKGTPVVRRVRKATGLPREPAGSPKEVPREWCQDRDTEVSKLVVTPRPRRSTGDHRTGRARRVRRRRGGARGGLRAQGGRAEARGLPRQGCGPRLRASRFAANRRARTARCPCGGCAAASGAAAWWSGCRGR